MKRWKVGSLADSVVVARIQKAVEPYPAVDNRLVADHNCSL